MFRTHFLSYKPPTTPSDHNHAIRSAIPNQLMRIVTRIVRAPHNVRGPLISGPRLRIRLRLRYSASFFANSWLMIFGLPWPRISFMH